MLHPKKTESGQTIIEILVVVTLTAITFVGILALSSLSIKSSSRSRNQNLTSYYSYQAADWLRSAKDTYGWGAVIDKIQTDAGSANDITYCLNNLPSDSESFRTMSPGACQPDSTIPTTIYMRYVQINLSDLIQDNLTAKITTSWLDNTDASSTIELNLGKTQ
jgi:Tfp pilus assembly protein PilV